MATFGTSRRVRAYAYTLVTTVIVLVLAASEWAIERFISEYSRGATTAIELAVVLIAALVFRPVHTRVEAAAEAALYKKRRQALASMERFRHELTSFDDLNTLLGDVVAAVDRHFDARACAVYLRRESFIAQASTFEGTVNTVAFDDPLVERFHRSSSPARQQPLKSAAPGTHAFAMAAAGELNGFLAVQCNDPDFDPEEIRALTVLARELAIAVGALDPALRPQKRTSPNNLPSDLSVLIGREAELHELAQALAQSHLVTVTGAGGVGKTALALQSATAALARHQDGAWFVNLASITDGHVVAATVLAALDVPTGDEAGNAQRLIGHLKPRDILLVLDNCEHLVSAVSEMIAAVRASCPGVSFLTTSRETLHLPGEHVMRLASLTPDAAAELFAQRASAVSGTFDAVKHAATVRGICERLDGIPLAIELAAARARVLGVEEIAERLHERFRLLTSGSASALPRQQTLSALIEWSYDLLSPAEQSLFRRLGVFRGSFSLDAACAVCANGACDEYEVLDTLSSLADKSLLTVTIEPTTRYRFLETIREFAWSRALQAGETDAARDQHAAFFATAASQAYYEFDTKLPPGWLDRLEADIDNFRAVLEYTLIGKGSRVTGAAAAGDCGPMFLRLQLLGEGLRWCAHARVVPNLPAVRKARIEYVASMMHNNLGNTSEALTCALRAADLYRETPDKRGTVRALSQVAQQYGRAGDFQHASAPANEAIARARELNEPRVIVGVLRRCAFSLPPAQIDVARGYFKEALEIARTSGEKDEVSLVLEWWSKKEAAAGDIARAIDLSRQALAAAADPAAALALELSIAGWSLSLGRFEDARPHAYRSLELAKNTDTPLAKTLAILYCAPFYAQTDANVAAQLFDFANLQLRTIGTPNDESDALAIANASAYIRERSTSVRDAQTPAAAPFDERSAIAILSSA